jgi:hypothetical protein
MSGAQDTATAHLLREVFPEGPGGDPAYLDWLYRGSPFGPVVEVNIDDDAGRAAHYAVVPCALRVDGAPRTGGLSLNTAVHERARGGGMFTRLAEETFTHAAGRGITDIIGVANANSTPGFTRRLGFTLLGPLPVHVLLPRRAGRAVTSRAVNEALLGSPGFRATLGSRLATPAEGLAREWTPETLVWRLSCPTGRYAWHESGDAAMVTTVARTRGFPVAIVLKVLSAGPVPVPAARRLIGAACRFHRAPIALHAGVNPRFPLQGTPLPDRLRPSPLNFIHRSLDGAAAPALADFEFLDFDAY